MSFKKSKREEIHKKYKGHCAYCGDKIKYSEMHIDHIIPKYNFLDTIKSQKNIPEFLKHLTLEDMNHDDNLNPSCRSCNKFKDTFHLELFREQLEKQLERVEVSSANFRRALKYNQVKKTPCRVIFFFERERIYRNDGEHYVLQFDSNEERWFLNWVIMRANFKKSQENVRQLVKDVNYWRNRTYELEKLNKDLRESNNRKQEVEIKEAQTRSKMIEEFNKKNNKGRNYRKKKKR